MPEKIYTDEHLSRRIHHLASAIVGIRSPIEEQDAYAKRIAKWEGVLWELAGMAATVELTAYPTIDA